ncbi:GtrA family protein [Vibrio sp. EJY3]|uniref:GtrA family protein n=1 Tax=Vibrio natriegens TaxID=691 RepID=UPI0013051240
MNKPTILLNNLIFSDLRQKVLFIFVGVFNTFISYLSFVLLLQWSVSYIKASILSYTIGMISSYILNRNIVFHADKKDGEFLYFFLVNLISMITSTGILYVCVNYLGVYVYLAQVVGITCSSIINYIGYRAVFT